MTGINTSNRPASKKANCSRLVFYRHLRSHSRHVGTNYSFKAPILATFLPPMFVLPAYKNFGAILSSLSQKGILGTLHLLPKMENILIHLVINCKSCGFGQFGKTLLHPFSLYYYSLSLSLSLSLYYYLATMTSHVSISCCLGIHTV